MKLIIDMNLSPRWVGFLQERGFDAVHWSEAGDPRAPDAAIMQWAREHDSLVLTRDLDFAVLLALTRQTGPSVVLLRAQDVLPEAIGADTARILREQQAMLDRGAIVVIDEAGSRVRILPIQQT